MRMKRSFEDIQSEARAIHALLGGPSVFDMEPRIAGPTSPRSISVPMPYMIYPGRETTAVFEHTLSEAASAGIPRQVAAPVSCEAIGRIRAEIFSREIEAMIDNAEEDGD